MLNRIIQLGGLLFIASTIALLVLTRVEPKAATLPSGPELAVMVTSVVTLPLVPTKVVMEGDTKSRRNSVVLIGLCVVLVGFVLVFTK